LLTLILTLLVHVMITCQTQAWSDPNRLVSFQYTEKGVKLMPVQHVLTFATIRLNAKSSSSALSLPPFEPHFLSVQFELRKLVR